MSMRLKLARLLFENNPTPPRNCDWEDLTDGERDEWDNLAYLAIEAIAPQSLT